MGGKTWILGSLRNPANSFGDTPLHYAADRGRLDICQLLVENVQDRNPANNKGQTPLELAKTKGHDNVVQLLTAKTGKF